MTSGHTDPAYQREHGTCRTPCKVCANFKWHGGSYPDGVPYVAGDR